MTHTVLNCGNVVASIFAAAIMEVRVVCHDQLAGVKIQGDSGEHLLLCTKRGMFEQK